MKVSVIYAGSLARSWINIDIKDEATISEIILQSGILQKHPEINLGEAKVGIFGKFTSLDQTLTEGDRIEIYRPISRVLDEDDDD